MKEIKKVLILRPRFLGDIILSTGLAEFIHRHNPEAEIWFLVEDPYQSVLQNHQQVAGILSLDPKQKDNPLYLLDFQIKIRSHRFDAVLDLFGNPRTAWMTALSGATYRVGFDRRGRRWAYNRIAYPPPSVPPTQRRPVTEAFLDQLRVLEIPTPMAYRTSLYLLEEERTHVRKLLDRAGLKPSEPLAVLTPGASWPAKRWPLDRFVELGFFLESKGIRPLFLFGPKEEALVAEFEARMNRGWILINQPSLRGLVAFIESADVLIANDAGPVLWDPPLAPQR